MPLAIYRCYQTVTYNNTCIRCFGKIVERIEQKSDRYLKEFGQGPEFKSDYYLGEVSTGEIRSF